MQSFWFRPDIDRLNHTDQVTYIKLLAGSSVYGLHGISFLGKTIKSGRKIRDYFFDLRSVRPLAAQGFVLLDEIEGLVFVPGACSDPQAGVVTTKQYGDLTDSLKKLPFNSPVTQVWALSWYLSNLAKTNTQVSEDFKLFAHNWFHPLFLHADLGATERFDSRTDVAELVLGEKFQEEVYVQHLFAPILLKLTTWAIEEKYILNQLTGPNFEVRYKAFTDKKIQTDKSLSHKAISLFEQLYLARTGVKYVPQSTYTRDIRTVGMMIKDFGMDLVMERIQFYLKDDSFTHSIRDFRLNFQKVKNPELNDRSSYWQILEEHKNRARGDS